MKQIYSWKKSDNQITKDIQLWNWQWSERKNKYYCKFETEKHMIIWFKNNFVIIFEMGKGRGKPIEPLRNYYHIFKDWLAYEIIPKFNMPF